MYLFLFSSKNLSDILDLFILLISSSIAFWIYFFWKFLKSEFNFFIFAVGLRVNKAKNDDGVTIYKTVYKATDGEIYPAVYSDKFNYWFYMDGKGVQRECH